MNFTNSLMRLRVGCNWWTFHERTQRKRGVDGGRELVDRDGGWRWNGGGGYEA